MKKLNKLFAILVAMAMVLSLSIVSAFAEDTNPTTGKKAYFSKILNIANGLTAPDVDFEFTATPKTVDKIDYVSTATAGEQGYMPTFEAKTINFKTKTTGTDGNIVTTAFFDFDVTFPHAGVYVYEINETIGNVDGVTYNTGSDKYTITVTVKDDNGTPKVDRVVVQDKDGNKVDADQPTEKDPSANGSEDDNMSKMKFTNNYTKTADQTDTKDGKDASFVVDKLVEGDFGDKTKEFEFTITVTYPETATDAQKAAVKFYKYDSSAESNKTTDVTSQVSNGAITLGLANGDEFYVQNAPVGTTYTVVENLQKDVASKKYAAKTVAKEGNEEITTKGGATAYGTAGANVTLTDLLVKDTADNSAVYTNKNITDDTTDPGTTGILVSNLPYIALALVAIGGLVAYVVVRRKADDEA